MRGLGGVAVLSLVWGCTSAPDPVGSHELAEDVELDDEELAFLDIINDYRADNGLGSLTASPTLDTASDGHSHDLADQNYFSHTGLDGRDPSARCLDAGYPAGCAENIFAGSEYATVAFENWRNSPGHNANMLGGYVAIGIGRAYNESSTYGWYWTNNFGGVVDGDATCACEDGAVEACDNGGCAGQHTCTDCAWSECDAAAPSPEECDGLDNDCNGETDEGIECGGDADVDSDADDSETSEDDGALDGTDVGFEGGCACGVAGFGAAPGVQFRHEPHVACTLFLVLALGRMQLRRRRRLRRR